MGPRPERAGKGVCPTRCCGHARRDLPIGASVGAGRAEPTEWRKFAEEFRLLMGLAKGSISEDELRDHLMHNCLPEEHARSVVAQERRSERRKTLEFSGLGT